MIELIAMKCDTGETNLKRTIPVLKAKRMMMELSSTLGFFSPSYPAKKAIRVEVGWSYVTFSRT
jgi:hypothetical protein